MECRDVRDRLSGYLEGELPATEGVSVRGHLASCPVCRRELEGLKRTLVALHGLEEAPAPETGAEEALRKVRERKTERAPRRRRAWIGPGWAWGVPVQAAAMVAVVFFALYLTRNPAHSPETGSLTMAEREAASLREQAPEKAGAQGGSGERPAGTSRVAPSTSPGEPAEEAARERAEREKAPPITLETAKKKVPRTPKESHPEWLPPAGEAVSLLNKEETQKDSPPPAPALKDSGPEPAVVAGKAGPDEAAERKDLSRMPPAAAREKVLLEEGNRFPQAGSTPAAPVSPAGPVREWVVKSDDLPAAAARLRTALAELGGEVLEDDGQTIVARLPGTRMGRLEEVLSEGAEVDRPAGRTAEAGKAEGAGPARGLSGLAQRDRERSKGIHSPGRQKKVRAEDQVRVKIRLVPKENR